MKKYYVVSAILLISVVCGQTGYLKTPKQLYRSIDSQKPTGEELFGNEKKVEEVDLTPYFPEPGYQGKLGACAAWAAGYACKTYQETKERGWDPKQAGKQFSPSFLYNQVNKGNNRGSTFPDIFNVLKEKGCATLQTMPYTLDYLKQPDAEAFLEAEKYKIASFRRLENGPGLLPAIKAALRRDEPVVVAMKVYEDFTKLKNKAYRQITGVQRGGHGMCILGYDDKDQTLKLINSWGKRWGESGYCRIGYALADELIMEAYVCTDIAKDPLPEEKKEVELLIPKALRASEGAYENEVVLEWQAIEEDSIFYKIYRSNPKKETLDFLAKVNAARYTDSNTLDKVKYLYAVKAVKGEKESKLSEVACGWASREELGIPGGLKADLQASLAVLNWREVTKAEAYNIYRLIDEEENFSLIGRSEDENFRDTDLPLQREEDLRLYYVVTALRDEEESDQSNMVTLRLPAREKPFPLPPMTQNSKDRIVPKSERKTLNDKRESRDYYDPGYMQAFFDAARKAEAEAFKKMRQEEENAFEQYRNYEKMMKKKYK